MGRQRESGITWTDRTWNPVTGCTKVSAGCKHCYAEVMAKRTFRLLYPQVECVAGPMTREHAAGLPALRARRFTDVQCHPERLEAPLRWRKPARVFVNSMSDLFHEDVPDEFIDRVFAVMALAPQHTFQVLTKRPERMRAYLSDLNTVERIELCLWEQHTDDTPNSMPYDGVLPNVWLGVSIEDQATADARIPLLLKTPAAVRWVSAEPLLGPIDLTRVAAGVLCPQRLGHHVDVLRAGTWALRTGLTTVSPEFVNHSDMNRLDWVVVGGESGPKARPCDVAWIRSVVQQCQAAEVQAFVKQLGAHVITRNDDGWEGDTPRSWPMDTRFDEHIHGYREDYQGAPVRVRLRCRKGGDPSEWPEDLLVRQWPEVAR